MSFSSWYIKYKNMTDFLWYLFLWGFFFHAYSWGCQFLICWRRYSEEEEVTSFMVFYWIKQAFDTPVCEEDIFPNDDIESFIKVC